MQQNTFYKLNRQIIKKINFIIIKPKSKIISLLRSNNHQQQLRLLNMNQDIVEPVTHSILRNSQARRQSSLVQSNYRVSNNRVNKQANIEQRYHFKYYNSHQPYQSKRYSTSHVQNCQSQYSNQKREVNGHPHRENIVFCQSLPKTRPKYSFTFNQPEGVMINNNQTPRASLNIQSKTKLQDSQGRSKTRNVRSDIDVCLYTIADKLKQMELSKQPQQTKDFLNNKLGQPQPSGYKPSFSQLRKNKKMFVDRSIHRIHPEIVNQYIQTVYRDYDIPNPISEQSQTQRFNANTSRIQRQNVFVREQKNDEKLYFKIGEKQKQKQKQIQKQKEIEKNKRDKAQRQQNYRNKQVIQRQHFQRVNIEQRNIRQIEPQHRVTFQVNKKAPEPKQQRQTQQQKQREPQPKHQIASQLFRQDYSLHNTKNNRRNNLIAEQASQSTVLRKKFLNLTLSKQKDMKAKTFQSPKKLKSPVLQQKESQMSSRSRSKHSASQRKVLQIKKKISDWKDSQHQFAQRYSYLQSPYEMMNKTVQRQVAMRRQPGLNSDRPVNILVRPFEQLMKITAPTEYHEQGQQSQAINTATQYVSNTSQMQQSKYVQSFFNVEGEVLEQLRYCVLCQQSVLSANIYKHEEKCIGWIDNTGRLIMFRHLYQMEKEEELKQLMRGKVDQIQKRIVKMIDKLNLKQTSNNAPQTLNKKILQTVQLYLNSYNALTQHPMNINNQHILSSNYKKLQQITKDEYFLLLQQSRKLHWFVKLLQSYHNKNSGYKSQQASSKSKGFTSTKAKHNLSLTFVEEQQGDKDVSEFNGEKDKSFNGQKDKTFGCC